MVENYSTHFWFSYLVSTSTSSDEDEADFSSSASEADELELEDDPDDDELEDSDISDIEEEVRFLSFRRSTTFFVFSVSLSLSSSLDSLDDDSAELSTIDDRTDVDDSSPDEMSFSLEDFLTTFALRRRDLPSTGLLTWLVSDISLSEDDCDVVFRDVVSGGTEVKETNFKQPFYNFKQHYKTIFLMRSLHEENKRRQK